MRAFAPKVEAFLNEFEFLRVLDGEAFNILDVKVQRIDEDLLNRKRSYQGVMGRDMWVEILIYVSMSGGRPFRIGHVGQRERQWRLLNPVTWNNPFWDETVMECMRRCGRKLRQRKYETFALTNVVVLEPMSLVGREFGYRLILYKPPGRHTISSWIAEIRATAEASVKNEVETLERVPRGEIIS